MSTSAGWYPQPDGQQRYWDGRQWTQDFAPGVPPMAPPTGLPMAPPATTQQTPPPVTRKNWLLAYAVTAAKDRECIAADGTQAADDVDQKELS